MLRHHHFCQNMFLQLYLRGGHNASQGWKANAFHYHRLPLFTSYLSELTVFQVVLHLEFSTCFGTFFFKLDRVSPLADTSGWAPSSYILNKQ